MAIDTDTDLANYCHQVATNADAARDALGLLTGRRKNDWLIASADAIVANTQKILEANQLDLANAELFELTESQIDRLRLTGPRIEDVAIGLREIAALSDPIGQTISASFRPNGLEVRKIRVPLGVVFFIYESRPNVTVDAAAICIKSGNAVILRGGKEAANSSRAFVEILQETGERFRIPPGALQLVESADRNAVKHFLTYGDLIDVVIPRGGVGLIKTVTENAKMPVIKHFEGNCHVFVDVQANIENALRIAVNSKCQRTGVCNACESLLVHKDIAEKFLPRVFELLQSKKIEMVGDELSRQFVSDIGAAEESDFGKEFLGPKISICVVDSLDHAIKHINKYGSGHTDAIVTENLTSSREFCARVDSAAVMVNASTRFNDGGQFGLGAEIGISTDKFHARGPCGLEELTSYKYICIGNGQIR